MIFETLSVKHLAMLLQFESENKAWFESMLPPREDYFYRDLGIKMHIYDAIINMQLGTHYSGVLIVNEQIVARANLKDITGQTNTAAVGYRVAKNSIGKGYASFCLNELISIAAQHYAVNKLEALVLDNNPASKAVLLKCGFKALSHKDNYMTINGHTLGVTHFLRAPI